MGVPRQLHFHLHNDDVSLCSFNYNQLQGKLKQEPFPKTKAKHSLQDHHIGPALVREFERKETPTSLILQQVAYCAPVNYCQFHKFNLEYRDIIYQFFMALCHIRNNKELLVTFTLYSVHLLSQGFRLIEKQEEKPRNYLKLYQFSLFTKWFHSGSVRKIKNFSVCKLMTNTEVFSIVIYAHKKMPPNLEINVAFQSRFSR